jgi:hypothetical protein
MTDRIWYASPNGDWWGGSDMDYVMVLKESDLPEGIDLEEIEGDKFEDIIVEHGTVAYIEVGNPA